MSRNSSNTEFVLGFETVNQAGEKKVFALKNPRRSTLVDMSTGGRVKRFALVETAGYWLKKVRERKEEGLNGLQIIKLNKEQETITNNLPALIYTW